MRAIRLVFVVALFAMLAPLGLGGQQARAAQPLASCEPVTRPAATPVANQAPLKVSATPASGLKKVSIGYIPVMNFAPMFVAKDLGYFAEQGLDVELRTFAGGSEMIAQLATNDRDVGMGGAGPGLFNAVNQGLPVKIIAPGHSEGNPVATPLVVAKAKCESGEILQVSDLKGKKVAINAPGATDAAILGEPTATLAEQQGIGVRLVSDFDVQGIQPTMVYASQDFLKNDPEAAKGVAIGYMKAVRAIMERGFSDPEILPIIATYTNLPEELITEPVRQLFTVDGSLNVAGLNTLQSFFRSMGELNYDTDIDPNTMIDRTALDAALQELDSSK